VTVARFDKRRLQSRYVTEGVAAATSRTFMYGLGLGEADLHQPIVGVIAAYNGASPAGDAALALIGAAERGVWAGGATPRASATISDAGASGHGHRSLLFRELVADSAELTMRGHSYDAFVGLAASAASIAGLMMAMCRLDVPSALVALTGPELGSAPSTYAMAAVAKALGLAPPATASAGPGRGAAEAAAHAGGLATADRLAAGCSPRDLVTGEAVTRAARVLTANDGDAELLIHLVAIAHECGVALDLRHLAPDGGWVTGTLAPEGGLLTVRAGAVRRELVAQVFDTERAACEWLRTAGWSAGTALVVRGQGPRGGPGMPRLDALTAALTVCDLPPGALLVTDGWAPSVPGLDRISAVAPEAADGGPLAELAAGDALLLEPGAGTLDIVPAQDPERAPSAPPPATTTAERKYAQTVGPARGGAVTHPGAAGERFRYGAL
jgi:dihydroxyacid dehydratase/phosphogluconate dehydratase